MDGCVACSAGYDDYGELSGNPHIIHSCVRGVHGCVHLRRADHYIRGATVRTSGLDGPMRGHGTGDAIMDEHGSKFQRVYRRLW